MTGVALLLVVSSAFLHAVWNLLYKRAKDKPAFAWLFGVAGSAMYLPLFLYLVGQRPIPTEGWWLVVASSVLHTLYFTFIGRGYSSGELSLVYPVARGTGPLLVPVWAVFLLGEWPSPLGLAGILGVVGGVYLLHLREVSWRGLLAPLQSVRTRSTRIALFSGLLASLYAVVDGMGVRYVDPVVFLYLFMGLFTLLYGPFVLRTSGLDALRTEWRINALPILVAGFLVYFTYILVLSAMTMSKISYVAAARELSVVFGVAMGTFLLRESYGRSKLGASLLIAVGVALIGMAKT